MAKCLRFAAECGGRKAASVDWCTSRLWSNHEQNPLNKKECAHSGGSPSMMTCRVPDDANPILPHGQTRGTHVDHSTGANGVYALPTFSCNPSPEGCILAFVTLYIQDDSYTKKVNAYA